MGDVVSSVSGVMGRLGVILKEDRVVTESIWNKCVVVCFFFCFFVFFFKQKTAYEIGTGDWSSDVCSSDLETDDQGANHPNLTLPHKRIAE